MSALPQVTVVLCTYNRAHVVERTVRAVLAQKGCELDLVVVDDGSPDNTPEVLAAIDDPRLRVVRQANAGLSVARNSGLAVAEGDWVVFLDDDDLLYPTYGKVVAPHLDVADLVYTGWDLEGAEDPQPIPLDPFLLSWRNTIPVTACVRTEVFRAVGGFPIDHKLEDHGLWKAVLLAWDADRSRCRYRITYEPTVAWRYRRFPGSRTEETADD